MEPERARDVHQPVRKLDATTIALIGGLLLLVLLVAYFASRGSDDQDKLINPKVSTEAGASNEKACASKATYDLIKRELFRRAAQLRGSDQAAYDRLSSYAVVRMENPVMESADSSSGAVNCSGSLSLRKCPGYFPLPLPADTNRWNHSVTTSGDRFGWLSRMLQPVYTTTASWSGYTSNP